MEKPQVQRFTPSDALALLARARSASLATLNEDGGPFVSLVNLGSDHRGRPVLLLSRLAWHARNLEREPRGSLMAAEPASAGDALSGPRVTVMGRFEAVAEEGLRARYLARHPEAQVYVDFSDFGFWRLLPERVHAVAGFGRIETFSADEVFPPST